jgi:phenylalanyl-tRNA synthetase beta chain
MRVPLEWLREFVDFSISSEDLILKLTMIGLEVEGVERRDDDTILEVNVTPNRPDCLSMLGIAREVSALLNIPLKFPECRIGEEGGPSAVTVEITDEDLCHRYAGRDIKGVTIGESPEWMRKRIEKCGMRSINNVVDTTNYVLLELGHPLHAFDMDTLKGNRIRVARSGTQRKITTLDQAERPLPEDSLLIWDGERPVAVAGVMGGSETEVKGNTKNIFLESAYFLPASIRRTSRALGLKTESAYRFERGTDIELLERALDRAASLMAAHAGGKVSMKVDVYPRPFRPSRIEVRFDRVNRILGTSVAGDEMKDIVQRLGMKAEKEQGFFVVTPPPFRGDVQREIDVIEEIARLHGYEKIPVTVPRIPVSKGTKDMRYHLMAKAKEAFRTAGFTEAINYSFMNPGMLEALNIPENDERRSALTLRNPINEEEPLLRTTLIPSLIQNLVYNISMGGRDIRLFESSRVFIDKGEALPDEEHHLGAIYFREMMPSLWREETPDFYVMKGTVQSLLDDLRIGDYLFQSSSESFLHPGKSGDLVVSGRKIGFLGVLHPDILKKLSLKVSQQEMLVMELNLDTLLSSVSGVVKYTPIPRYPFIDRDIALMVDEFLTAAAIVGYLRAYPTELVEEIELFDFYKGKNIPPGKKSLAFTIRYRAKDRTLTDSEIEELHGKLTAYITAKTGGIVRGT